jgi:hypothetical protein
MTTINQRAAACMGWEVADYPIYRAPDGEFSLLTFDPEHDRNALALLLQEVGRRGMTEQLTQWFETHELDYEFPTIATWNYWLLTAPTELLALAAVEVLEQAGKETE